MKIGAEIWVHSNSETGKPCQFDIFRITGESIEMDLIESIANQEWRDNQLVCFDDLKMDTPHYAVIEIEYDESYWYIASVTAVEIPIPECGLTPRAADGESTRR